MDLISGHNQVPVARGDKAITAFCIPLSIFEFSGMQFGICNVPGTFHRLMDRMFGDCCYQSVLLYLDNVIIFS